MPDLNDTYYEVLTGYAHQLYLNPDEEVNLYAEIFPTVAVTEATGQYDKYGKDAALTAIDTHLTPENSAHRLKQLKTIGTFSLEAHGLEISSWMVNDPEASSQRHRQASLNTLMSAQFASNQKLAVDKLKAAVNVTENVGAWTNAAADPIGEIEKLLRAVRMGCGRKPTKIIMGHTAWTIVRNHPNVVSRVGGLTTSLSEEQFLDLFSIRGLKLVIADTTVELEDGTMCELLEKDVIVLYSLDEASESDLSFGKNFTTYPNGPDVVAWTQNGITGVDTLVWKSDENITNPNACARLVIS